MRTMPWVACARITVVLIAAALAGDALAQDAGGRAAARVGPRVHRGDGWAIVAPQDWGAVTPVPAPVVLHLVGDGREGVPLFDGTLSVLKAGLQVQVFPRGELTLDAHAARDLKELKESGAFEPLGEPQLKEVALADGTRALLLEAEFVRVQNRRVSLQSKVYAADAGGRHVVATGFITYGRPGRKSVKTIALPDFVRAHVLSLVLDPAKADLAPVRQAYAKHNWAAAAAVARAGDGNDLIEKERFGDAAAAFRQALKGWDHLPAAHNGLAWALLHDKAARPDAVQQAVGEARAAVEESEGLDFAALDTLALAYDRAGDKARALETIQRALKLQPQNPDLRARLKALE